MKKVALHQVVYQGLMQNIRTGVWRVGDLLPTEQALSQQYSVSRITVRHALSQLAEEGYIRRVQGKGSVVTEPPGQTPVLGLALSNFDDLFGSNIVKGVLYQVEKMGYLVMVRSLYATAAQEGEALRTMVQAGVQGIIHMPLYDAMRYTDELMRVSDQVPMVFVDRRVLGIDVPLVCTDNAGGVRTLCYTLRENGYRRIAFVSSNPDSTAVGERLKGFLEACGNDSRRLTYTQVRSMLPEMDSEESEAYDVDQIARFLTQNQPIEAVVAHTWYVAKYVEKALGKMGLRVPQDCAVVCFDQPTNLTGDCHFAHMRQDEFYIGVTAVKRMAELLAGKPVPDCSLVDAVFMDGESYQKVAR